MSRLRRFLPPQVADLIVASGSEKQEVRPFTDKEVALVAVCCSSASVRLDVRSVSRASANIVCVDEVSETISDARHTVLPSDHNRPETAL
jgi:hypothetical protein